MSMMESYADEEADVAHYGFGLIERNNTIKAKIDHINKYLRATEKIYASNQGYDTKVEASNQQGYEKRLRFRTKDFVNQQDDYEILFNQTIDSETNTFSLTGEMTYKEDRYLIDAMRDTVT